MDYTMFGFGKAMCAQYGEDYYERRWRESGALVWEHPAQQRQLKLKMSFLERFFEKGSVLFIGCAKGFEVRMAREMGWDAYGTDFSEYAIAHADPEVKNYVRLADTRSLPFSQDAFDVVAGFNALEHVGAGKPNELSLAFKEVSRVARSGLLFKLSCKHWVVTTCLDPALIYLQPFTFWVEGIERLNKHLFFRAEVGSAPLHAWMVFYHKKKWDVLFGDNPDAKLWRQQIESALKPT